MRPIRLEISGFTAFREPAIVDFEGCEFFALCGATGAGKSSIIDAICFALYGSVPRLGERQVAPVMAQGMLEAKVRLDFLAGGAVYTALRVVRRTKTGATTSEARLQRGDDVLAGNADALGHEVEGLLGLGFDHFTKCVVLPQGEFAEFLHAKPAQRGELLSQLLGLQVYRAMGQRARELSAVAQRHVEWLTRKLDEELNYATPESREAATARLRTLEELWAAVEEAQPRSRALQDAERAAAEEADAAQTRAALLEGVRVPEGLADLAGRIATARAARDAAASSAAAAETRLREAEDRLAALGPRNPLDLAMAAHRERADAILALDAARERLAGLVEAEAEASKRADEAAERAKTAQDAFEHARLAHRAHDLTRTLVAGEPCPVCLQTVSSPPETPEPAGLRAAQDGLEAAAAAAESTRRALAQAEHDRVAADAQVAQTERALAALDEKVASHPDPAALARTLADLDHAEREAAAARDAARAARAGAETAQRNLAAAEASEKTARRAFDETRDALAALGPPPPGRDDLGADWDALAAWVGAQAPRQRETAAAARERAAAAAAERRALSAALVDACRAAGVEPAAPLSSAVAKALADQQSLADRIEQALGEIARVTQERANAEEEGAIAARAGQHLQAKGFEAWLLEEAVRELVAGATQNLRELSSGAYSLALDQRTNGFEVVDHRNADERRPVRTLSGGETFLASLALALALSDRLADMAAEGAHLDAIFLDEGFGTLDAETLATVSSAIETLAHGGRMVGLVTHVREIAEWVPVRFEVRKAPDGSRVERIDA